MRSDDLTSIRELTFEFLNELGFEEFADWIAASRLVGPHCPWLTQDEGDQLHRLIHSVPEPGGPAITFRPVEGVAPSVPAFVGYDESRPLQFARPAQIYGKLGSIGFWAGTLLGALRIDPRLASSAHGGRSSALDARCCLQQMGAAIERTAQKRNARAPKTARCVTRILMINQLHLALHESVTVNTDAFPVSENMRFPKYRKVCNRYVDARKRAHAEASMVAQGIFRIETVKLINAEVRELIRDRRAVA